MSDIDTGQVMASAAEVYDEFFVPALFGQWPDVLLDAVGIGADDAVVDVGCGTGVLARAAARRVGSRGRSVGVDVNEGMLAVARRSPEQVEWRHADALDLPFADGEFVRAVSQFVLMFVDRPAVLREMTRVVRPGGTVGVATWAALDATPGYAAMVEVLEDVCGPEAARALTTPYCLGDVDVVRALVEGHLDDVDVRVRPGVARFPSVDGWVHTDVKGWTLSDTVDDETYAELLRVARERLSDFVDDSGAVEFPAPAVVACGRVPGDR